MITDLAIDQALIELKRTEKALLELRDARKAIRAQQPTDIYAAAAAKSCGDFSQRDVAAAMSAPFFSPYRKLRPLNAAAKRASMDLTRKLAALRAGR